MQPTTPTSSPTEQRLAAEHFREPPASADSTPTGSWSQPGRSSHADSASSPSSQDEPTPAPHGEEHTVASPAAPESPAESKGIEEWLTNMRQSYQAMAADMTNEAAHAQQWIEAELDGRRAAHPQRTCARATMTAAPRARRLELERKRREAIIKSFSDITAYVNQFHSDFTSQIVMGCEAAAAPITPESIAQDTIPAPATLPTAALPEPC